MVIRVLVADDNAAVRASVCQLVARDPQMRVVAEADDGDAAARLARELRPDVALVDISMPRVDGLEATRRIVSAQSMVGPGGGTGGAGGVVRVIALSLHAEWQVVVEALRAGAAGYLLKSGAARELGRAVRCVAGGHAYLSERVIEAIRLESPAASGCRLDLLHTLTDQERRALDVTSCGFAYHAAPGAAAAAPGCMPPLLAALEACRGGIMQKLKLPTFAELVRFALRQQLAASE